MAKITIFGLAGTGTTTIGKLLAERLTYTFRSTGTLFRKKAAELGFDLYAFEKICKEDPSYDRMIEDSVELFGKDHDNFVLESRLGWYSIPDSFKIKITCDFKTRITRVAARDGISYTDAEEKTLRREEDGISRYRINYKILNFGDDRHFNMIIDSTTLSPDQIVDYIIKKIGK